VGLISRSRGVRIRRLVRLALLALMLAGAAEAAESKAISINLGAAYFWPKDDIFREVYGGGPRFGVGIEIPIVGGFRAWAGAEMFRKGGEVTFTGQATTLQIVPVFGGVDYRLPGKVIQPYAGLALAYFMFKEESELGTVRGKDLGFLGQAGAVFQIGPSLGLDVYARVTACRAKPDLPEAVPAEIGGYELGAGLVIRF